MLASVSKYPILEILTCNIHIVVNDALQVHCLYAKMAEITSCMDSMARKN